MEDWEIHWEDYYEILQVHPLAEPEVIEAAYKKLALKYHPDVDKDPAAGERMKKINIAYRNLSDPEKRKQYHLAWLQKKGKDFQGAPKPKPVVNPDHIYFEDAKPGEIKVASFIVKNTGGPYTKIWVSNPDSWVRVTRYFSLTDSDELPLQVEIEAEGEDWDKTYIGYIQIRLDEEETQVEVELRTMPEPIGEKKVGVGVRPSPKTTYTPSPSRVSVRRGIPTWAKWAVGAFSVAVVVGVIIISLIPPPLPSDPLDRAYEGADRWVEDNLPGERDVTIPTEWPVAATTALLRSEVVFCVVVGENNSWATVYDGCDRQTCSFDSKCRQIFPGTGYIIYSPDCGKKWEIQKKISNWCPCGGGRDAIKFISETEGYAVGDTGILHTNDMGKHWYLLDLPSEIQMIKEVESIENHHLVIYCNYEWTEYESFDGGITWQEKIG